MTDTKRDRELSGRLDPGLAERLHELAQKIRGSANGDERVPGRPTPLRGLRSALATMLESAELILHMDEASTRAFEAHERSLGRVDVRECQVLNLTALLQGGLIAFGGGELCGAGGTRFPITVTREDPLEIEITSGGGHQRINLASLASPFGGRRSWFVCPGVKRKCGRRVPFLFLPPGGVFACGVCANVAYRSGHTHLAQRQAPLQFRPSDKTARDSA
jgi:hypothetical protein